LIESEIVDVAEATFPDDPFFDSHLKTEVIDLEEYGANRDTLTLLATDSTMYITGWIWIKAELAFIEFVSNFICAWEVVTPTKEELSTAPIMLIRPQFLFGLYNGNRELFSLLCKIED
jgi:hypothetical protein